MTDMTKHARQTPAQQRERLQWVLDTVRANQHKTKLLLDYVAGNELSSAIGLLNGMHKMDRDALLQPGGILTDEQLEWLKGD